MSGSNDARAPASASNLTLRVASAAVLAPVALLAAYLGGWPFTLFWAFAAIAVLWEWITLVTGPLWIVAGVGYAAVLLAAPVLLRADSGLGLFAIILLFAVVWTTDVLGYFAGRAFGGPKLLPAVSPKKTWSGAVAGTFGAAAVAIIVAGFFGSFRWTAVALIALMLSVAAQLGDLLESWIKRQFGAKDAGSLIPGHGGVMDRLDGFWAAALIGCLLGLARGGFDAPARGLLVW
ncbi:MAG TPA: phosphatidate cytidylyltransferase [Pseudolabrys sp.]|nr:phosphatidate cytidylyltransferase [Pseudolabrys sp.]